MVVVPNRQTGNRFLGSLKGLRIKLWFWLLEKKVHDTVSFLGKGRLSYFYNSDEEWFNCTFPSFSDPFSPLKSYQQWAKILFLK
jgi:hypothetical protein